MAEGTDEPDEGMHPPRRDWPVVLPQPDPVAPLFFVSHATVYGDSQVGPDTDPNTPFGRFYLDLSQDLGQLAARRAGADPGFLDRGMRAGVDWEREILTAVGTCQVLVALMSEPFAKSAWCGREWDAFSRRRTWRRADRAPMPGPMCILPVVWAPNPGVIGPKVVASTQLFVPKAISEEQSGQIGPRYKSEGVYGLYMTEQRAYRGTVWRLAQEIKRLIVTYWVEPDVPANAEGLTNVFAEEEP